MFDLVHDLVYGRSGGASIKDVPIPYGTPPLSHEDGCVYRTAADAGDAPTVIRYCVTRDVAFRRAALPGDVLVVHPWEWVQLVRHGRRLHAATVLGRPATPS